MLFFVAWNPFIHEWGWEKLFVHRQEMLIHMVLFRLPIRHSKVYVVSTTTKRDMELIFTHAYRYINVVYSWRKFNGIIGTPSHPKKSRVPFSMEENLTFNQTPADEFESSSFYFSVGILHRLKKSVEKLQVRKSDRVPCPVKNHAIFLKARSRVSFQSCPVAIGIISTSRSDWQSLHSQSKLKVYIWWSIVYLFIRCSLKHEKYRYLASIQRNDLRFLFSFVKIQSS